jgi:transposase
MSREPLPMQKIEPVLRLHHQQGLSIRQIAHRLGLKRSTVSDYLQRAAAAGLVWPLPTEWSERDLHRTLLGPPCPGSGRPQPDWAYIHCELRKKSVTLQLLHEEYLEQYADGYRYSQFCEFFRRFRKSLNVCMRQTYRAGEKLFVDYAGQTIDIVGRDGAINKAHLFVAVLGASNYTYAEATITEALEDWIAVHINAFEYFGGVSALTIPDNTKCAVVKPCRYEPEINPTYLDLATHYGTCIIPARVARPKDKAKAEAGVLVAERWILAALRKRTFFSVAELNLAIGKLLDILNKRPFKKLPGCRQNLFTELDKPALLPLPRDRYEYAEWRQATANIDYHVAVYLGDRRYHYYSVPYTLVNHKLDVRLSRHTVEVYFKGKRVAAHMRSDQPGHHTTLSEHMPEAHKRYLQWTPGRILNWAGKTGPACGQVVQSIIDDRPHPEQGYRSCLGIIRLGDRYGKDRLEAVCKRALLLQLVSYKSIKNMLNSNHDKLPMPDDQQQIPPINEPSHVRGSAYYQ